MRRPSAAFAPLPGGVAAPRPAKPPTREAFIAEQRAHAVREGLPATDHPGGYRLSGRPYVALACHLPDQGFAGWVMVHDDPADLSYFDKLFGPDRQGRLPL